MNRVIELPQPQTQGLVSIEETISQRRSVREYSQRTLSLEAISQLLWAAQGITDSRGYRSVASAGALYPLELYAVIEDGVYRYFPDDHTLSLHSEGDVRLDVYNAALQQDMLLLAPLTVVITAVYARIEVKYGRDRGPRYVHMEVGHSSHSLALQAVALGLGTVFIGAFHDNRVTKALKLPRDHEPLLLITIGHPR
jgi:SagB-type dehydrogenase family enzyme